jgi:hypothetical protein
MEVMNVAVEGGELVVVLEREKQEGVGCWNLYSAAGKLIHSSMLECEYEYNRVLTICSSVNGSRRTGEGIL